MEHYDAIIVGGGPAGSTCARALRLAGLDLLLLDKHSFPRDKVCAGWITPAVVRALELDCAEYARHHVLQPFYGFATGIIGRRPRYSDFDRVVSHGIRRCEFDDYLLRRSGARLALGEPITELEHRPGQWHVNGRYSAPLLIGAGGHFCPVARALGARPGADEHVIAAQELEFEMTPAQQHQCSVESSCPELYFCDDLKGYGWCVRKGDYLNVGLGREDNRQLAGHVAVFRERLIRDGRIPPDTPRRFQGHAYLLSRQVRPRPLVADNTLLIGDACGLAYPQSGEGIRPAIESALLAACNVVNADGDYRAERLRRYEADIIERFGRRDADADTLGWLPAPLRRMAARGLLRSGWFSRHVLIERWFLHQHQPALPQRLAG